MCLDKSKESNSSMKVDVVEAELEYRLGSWGRREVEVIHHVLRSEHSDTMLGLRLHVVPRSSIQGPGRSLGTGHFSDLSICKNKCKGTNNECTGQSLQKEF